MFNIKKWLRQDISNLTSYQVAEANDLIKLDAMESPYQIPKALHTELQQKYLETAINRYPDAQAQETKNQCRLLMNIPKEFDILLGNGSDELIQLLALACGENDTLMSFEPSFVMYKMIAKWTRLQYLGIPLSKDFDIDLEETLKIIQAKQPKIIFISYPNNPTGNLFNRQKIEKIIEISEGLVVLDEAYYAYAEDSFITDIKKYNNLVVLRTVSKVGFAGLRLGLLIGQKDIISQFDKLRMPYNINNLTQASAVFLLNQSYVQVAIKNILKQRSLMLDALKNIPSLHVFESQTNFILFKTQKAEDLFSYLKDNGVLIKNLNTNIKNGLRVTIGTESENQTFIKIVQNFYE
jgi:histidinol-phosphate aminotransferase